MRAVGPDPVVDRVVRRRAVGRKVVTIERNLRDQQQQRRRQQRDTDDVVQAITGTRWHLA